MNRRDYEKMQEQCRKIMEYKQKKMERFKEVTTALNHNFDNSEFQYAFSYTESKSDTIHVSGMSDDSFVISMAVGVLLTQIRKSNLNAKEVFRTLFKECTSDEIRQMVNALYGKQS